uniref:Transmembrane protein n=1 Tax=Hydatigena taeniaeformis TaxID=6205 RepID=A0A0R3WZ61_HYDTA
LLSVADVALLLWVVVIVEGSGGICAAWLESRECMVRKRTEVWDRLRPRCLLVVSRSLVDERWLAGLG